MSKGPQNMYFQEKTKFQKLNNVNKTNGNASVFIL